MTLFNDDEQICLASQATYLLSAGGAGVGAAAQNAHAAGQFV